MARTTRAKRERPGKPARASRKAAVAAIDEVEEIGGGGLGIDDGVIISCSVILLAAVVMIYMARGMYV